MKEIEIPLDSYKEWPGPILLLAGPGTGKTFQLAKRIKWLIEEKGAKPNEITVITFTNEASRNMRERLSRENEDEQLFLPKENHPDTISTMHSLGNKIIGREPKRYGLKKDYDVLNERAPRIVFLQDACTITGFDRSNWKLVDVCRRKGDCQVNENEDRCKICKEYKKILRKCSLVDYDDQILLASETLKADEVLRINWKKRTRYLLVDEYQDINQAQCEFIKILTERQTDGLFVVGDDDQSIYSFRGGSPHYIREFEAHFGKDTKIGRLSKSWRCPEHILKGARVMVENFYKDSVPKPDPVFSDKIDCNNKIVFYDVPSDDFEARLIAAKISKKRTKTDNVIIIIPNQNYLPPIKEALTKAGLNYRCRFRLDDKGLVRFTVLYDWAEDPHNNANLRYLIHLTINNFDQLTSKLEAKNTGITHKRQTASELVAHLWTEVNNNNSLYQVISSMAERKDDNPYFFDLKSTLEEVLSLLSTKGSKRDGLQPFLEKCGLLVAPGKNPNGLITEVREWINEIIGGNKPSSYQPVSIYNLPSSKGLEADTIFVVGLSEKLFPDPKDDIEEQSRLLFVAMTRAKKELHLFSCRTRPADITFIKDSFQLERSRFINVIPEAHIVKNEIYPKKKVRKACSK